MMNQRVPSQNKLWIEVLKIHWEILLEAIRSHQQQNKDQSTIWTQLFQTAHESLALDRKLTNMRALTSHQQEDPLRRRNKNSKTFQSRKFSWRHLNQNRFKELIFHMKTHLQQSKETFWKRLLINIDQLPRESKMMRNWKHQSQNQFLFQRKKI